ncbi:uncharacterized protein with ParB-like and HNH nuclease domain [Flavobacterium sp. 7E]|uniref:DUF262 domain-containing protein n=1 Tax=Flavobacterium sp. 7E TaxID=2735898 RepID=UPI00156E977A|nr:DUF262 domain-containing protein [Flavobacterium sp. 7E]NRS90428.1 uncharacterized protein with ParB-like and HNH nuclease domain [Flavobacterium sp. 7E]
MATINDQINIEPQKVKWVIDLMNASLLTVDNSFQRNYVWLEKHQIKLIETILLGFPIPEIYLWQKDTDSKSGNMKFSIIDGQQRLGAILNFINDEFSLQAIAIDEKNLKMNFVGKKFSELSDDERSAIWKFKLSLRIVGEEIERNDVVNMFLRLNSTNMSLNPQELRNAEFEGLFIKAAAEIAENQFWKKHTIFSIQDLRRMNDIQLISSILLFFRMGIGEDTTQANFNKVYDLYNEEYSEKDEDQKLFYSIISEIERIINNEKDVERFIRKKTHLYTLFLLVYYFIRKQGGIKDKQISSFKNFVLAYNDANYAQQIFDKNTQEDIQEYKKLSSTGTQGKTNRMRRNDILKKILE